MRFRRRFNITWLLVVLTVTLVVLAGCERPKSTVPVPTAVAKATGAPATGMPTPAATKPAPVATTGALSSPIATPVPPTATTKPAPAPTQTPAPPAPGGQTTYVVKPGDWLWKIAREKGVSPQAIAAANPGLNVNLLYPGQTLIIPAPGSPAPAPAPGTGQVTHVVKAGENLFRIALKYNKTPQAIATANGITNVNLIYVGQVLIIP